MRDGALLVNGGRGALVDTDALVAEIERGRLRAVLDVADPQPLPPGHPLWTLDGVYISPQIGGDSPPAWRRAWRFAGEQIARAARGEPLHNVVLGG
jgi:phosphoglycerate dehydrogenase-like enzyme